MFYVTLETDLRKLIKRNFRKFQENVRNYKYIYRLDCKSNTKLLN